MKIAIIRTSETFSAIPFNDLSLEQTKEIHKILEFPDELWNPTMLKMIFPKLEMKEE